MIKPSFYPSVFWLKISTAIKKNIESFIHSSTMLSSDLEEFVGVLEGYCSNWDWDFCPYVSIADRSIWFLPLDLICSPSLSIYCKVITLALYNFDILFYSAKSEQMLF